MVLYVFLFKRGRGSGFVRSNSSQYKIIFRVCVPVKQIQYFGYLRRNPNDAPEPTLNYAGWKFWLQKLEDNGGDFVRAEIVKAFITSTEYRQRFGQ